jgi:cytochrome c oxidase cbb3-type subunit 1
MNAVTHFTHYTVAHAHLGLYGFVSFVFFGAMYFVRAAHHRRASGRIRG